MPVDTRRPRKAGPSRTSCVRAALGGVSLPVLLLVATAVWAAAPGAAAQGPTLAVDADPQGNAAADVGTISPCLSVSGDRDFQVDIVIEDVDDLLAWEIYLEYDPAIVRIIGRDVEMFQAANPGSNVYDVSERVPDSDGIYRLAAADTADPPSPDSGSGVLARLTLAPVGPGISDLTLARQDITGDGRIDRGPFLRNVDAEPISDEDDDGFFDGRLSGAQVAVDAPCPPGSQEGNGGRSGSGEGLSAIYIAVISVAAVAVAGFSVVLLYRRRARAQPH